MIAVLILAGIVVAGGISAIAAAIGVVGFLWLLDKWQDSDDNEL